MIHYLKGTIVQVQRQGQRSMAIVEVNHLAYEVQITPRFGAQLPPPGDLVQIFTHLQVREDQWTLYGFATGGDRDLFRHLISVSGIGAQMALALLETLEAADLAQAIVSQNSRALTRAPGIGSKTADRITLELKTKLTEWQQQTGLGSEPSGVPPAAIEEDVTLTLSALGYNDGEIAKALKALAHNPNLPEGATGEDWIREAIAWLSQT